MNGFALGSLWEQFDRHVPVFCILHPSCLTDALKLASYCGYDIKHRETIDTGTGEVCIVFHGEPGAAPARTKLTLIQGGRN